MITIQMSLLLQKNISASFCNILQAFMQDTIHQGFFIVLAVWILNDLHTANKVVPVEARNHKERPGQSHLS